VLENDACRSRAERRDTQYRSKLSIAVIASRRHDGIGRRLLVDLIDASLAQGYSAISLSVIEDNLARGLYQSAGFAVIEKHGRSWTMARHAGHSD
jgi:ribosomal protein S18 acetylase RimI-like enzyme